MGYRAKGDRFGVTLAIRPWRIGRAGLVAAMLAAASACGGDAVPGSDAAAGADGARRTTLVDLWSEGVPAFGIFVPGEGEPGARGPDGERLPPVYTAAGGQRLAANDLLDYVFLNLEGRYDPDAVGAIAEGLGSGEPERQKTLLVRIPPISDAGLETTRQRIAESLAAGADGIVLPHVRSAEEARDAVGIFEEMGVDVWSPANPDGAVIVMLMIEDPGALAAVEQIANVPGYSVLACGIGSLTRALGDREAGEAGNREVLEHAKRVGLPDMITANGDDVADRIEQGFLGLLMNGPDANDHIEVGRAAAGR
jgi:hypothetical protein